MTVNRCAIYNVRVGVRMEDGIRNLKIRDLAFGGSVKRKIHLVGRKPFPGYDNRGKSKAQSFELILKKGFK